MAEETLTIRTEDPKALQFLEHSVRKTDPRREVIWVEFVRDIQKNGIIQPPIITPETRKVVIGKRRVLAARELGLPKIQVLALSREPTPKEARAMSFRENHHREGICMDDRLDALEALLSECGNDKQKVADVLGTADSAVYAWLSIKRKVQQIDIEALRRIAINRRRKVRRP